MSVSAIVGGSVRGFLHEPEVGARDGIVLTHGAGGNCEMPLLVAVAAAFEAAGLAVLRCDLPFRQKRAFGAPSTSGAAADRAGLAEAAEWLRKKVSGRIFVGGQSYGGRQASMLVSEQPGVADGLILLSYPLHPPGKPAQLRITHFPGILRPALFVQGTKDPFGSTEELANALALIPAPTRHVIVERAGHDLARGRFDVKGLVAESLLELVEGLRPARPPRA